jgi:hypothetical protein
MSGQMSDPEMREHVNRLEQLREAAAMYNAREPMRRRVALIQMVAGTTISIHDAKAVPIG